MKNSLFSKNWHLLLIFFLGVNSTTSAQKTALFPCGTPAKKSIWLDKYQQSPDLYPKAGETLLYVPLSIHLLATDDGAGYFRMNQLLDALCTLNNDYAAANLYFYIQGDIDYINQTSWYEHETVLEGAEMMFQNDIPGTLNCYFVSDPAGNCGYNLPYASVAIAKSCASPNDHTWAHEVGHALSLPHPFLGWEGGQTHDGSMPPVFSSPAPVTVTYDYTFFQDTLILDTLIIDTTFVELVDRSNCHIAADGFCDTPSDYIANRWQCNNEGVSSFTQTDPNGEIFRSDGSLIMSYSDDQCANRFSTEQINAMRANLLDEHADWLENQDPIADISSVPALIAPTEGEPVQFNHVFLEWAAVENATSYLVLVSKLSSFNASLTDVFITTQPNILIESLSDNKNYYWKVRPYNSHAFCTNYSAYETFHTENMVATQNIQWQGSIHLSPTFIHKGQTIQLAVEHLSTKEATIEIMNTTGQMIYKNQLPLQNKNIIPLPETITSGAYFLVVKSGTNQAVFRFLLL